MGMTESVIIYLFTILTTAYAFHISRKTENKVLRNIVLLFAIAIPVTVAGLRYGIGEDYFSYINGFELVREGTINRWSGVEKGYVFLNLSLTELGLPAQSIMFVTSFITIYFISRALLNKRNNISVGFGILAFMFLFYQGTFNIIRMMLAVSIFFYNLSNIENHKLLRYSIFTILAISFHTSAVVTIPLYWVYNDFLVKKSFLRSIVMYLCVIILIIYFNQILNFIIEQLNLPYINYYNQYIGDSNKTIDISIKKALMYVPLLVPGAIMYKKFQQQDKSFFMYYSLTLIGIIIIACTTFNTAYVDRISLYFIIASIMLIAIYMKVFIKSNNYLGYFAVIIYLFSFWGYVYMIGNDHGTFPYQWIL